VIEYRDQFTWGDNIASLAGHLEKELAFRPDTRPTFPATNIPVIQRANQEALAAYDAETLRLALRTQAAREGALLLNPDDEKIPLVAMDKNHRKWRSEAIRQGKLVAPEEFVPSAHGWTKEAPLLVRRDNTPWKVPAADPQSGRTRV
jgi:hypothetical protein